LTRSTCVPLGYHQGTACLGLRSNEYVVLAGLKRSPNELASYQKKLFKIDEHMGVGMSGLTADGRSLIKYVPSTPSLYLAPQILPHVGLLLS